MSSKFIGDGNAHLVGSGWSYEYNTVADASWWLRGNNLRLGYTYYNGMWWDYGKSCWSATGNAGLSSAFIGDSAAHDVGNGWSYQYVSSTDSAYWWRNGVGLRLGYAYGNGVWWDNGKTGWILVAGALASKFNEPLSSQFLGDGNTHVMGNSGWLYQYKSSTDSALWWRNGVGLRLGYSYGDGRWWDYGKTGWSQRGANLPSTFFGDGTWHNVGNEWSYQYDTASDASWWLIFSYNRLSYTYADGKWHSRGESFTSWEDMVPSGGQSSAFIGDGALHTLNDQWAFSYSGNVGYWKNLTLNLNQFKYDYGTELWWDHGVYGDWVVTNGFKNYGTGPYVDLSPSFVGNGVEVQIEQDNFISYTEKIYVSYDYNSSRGIIRDCRISGGIITPYIINHFLAYDYASGQNYKSDDGITWIKDGSDTQGRK